MKNLDLTNESESLLARWKRERASRILTAVAPIAVFLCLVSTASDYFFGMSTIVNLGSAVLVSGSLLSLYNIRKKSSSTFMKWFPLYFGIWVGSSTNLWCTGGVESPYFVGFLGLLFVAAIVIQSQVRPLFVSFFIFANLAFWSLFPKPILNEYYVPPQFVFTILLNTIVLGGIMIAVYEFLRTEKNLADEIVDQYRKLATARENLSREESASAAKSSFLANISHELRTPLGAILGYAELIQDSNAAESERLDFAETIRRNGLQLSRLVDDLLDLSKVEAGKIEIEDVAFNPAQAISEVFDLLSLNAKRKGIDLRLNFQNHSKHMIHLDPHRFKQILMNVIGNAIKFTENGFVDINVFFPSGDAEAPSSFKIEVRDTGRGMTVEEQTKLFKPFSQADASVTRKFGGTGLGLNLSKRLSQLLGGDLLLSSSQMGVGSSFLLHLPWKPYRASAEIRSVHESKNMSQEMLPFLKGRKVLVVDDTLDNQRLISRYLQKWGLEVELASDGFEGIQKATTDSFELILMDIQMPVLDGLQAASVLRQKKYSKPLIALTAHAMKEDRERCLAAGFDDYLTKPVDRQLLKEKIVQALTKGPVAEDVSLSI